ncbi:MAG: 50S ribosomal protein L24e [Candidatus Micrarchaeia archaeon]
MPVCSFCGKSYDEGTGHTLFLNTGKAVRYCSHKCKRNKDLKRNPSKLKWTEKYVKGTQKKKHK